jgi:ribosome biogenesis protein Nip4
MGLFREPGSQEIDIVKEMAEALGGQGLKLEELLEKAEAALAEVNQLVNDYRSSAEREKPDVAAINVHIREFNALVDKSQDALRWLLIQREACGFRTHRNVNVFYPIPRKMKSFNP